MGNGNTVTGSQALPFVHPQQQGGPPKPAWSKIVEALIIAGVTAVATSWANQKVMKAELINVRSDITEIRMEQNEMSNRMFDHVSRHNSPSG